MVRSFFLYSGHIHLSENLRAESVSNICILLYMIVRNLITSKGGILWFLFSSCFWIFLCRSCIVFHSSYGIPSSPVAVPFFDASSAVFVWSSVIRSWRSESAVLNFCMSGICCRTCFSAFVLSG